MIIAVAGRRIDAVDAAAHRFPLDHVDTVREKLKALFVSLKPKAVVCSAACGADLLALEVAGTMKIPRGIVLPFDEQLFRKTSVTDRPGDWGSLYDKVLEGTSSEGKIEVLNYSPDDGETYRRTNLDILKKAKALGDKYGSTDFTAVIVWEGKPKSTDDTTEHFKNEAAKLGFAIREINTIR